MKSLLQFGVIFLLTIFSSGCDTNDNNELDRDNPIIGNWQLIEAYISSGGPQYLVSIENGEKFKFSINGTFSSNKYPECTSGNFSTESNELILKYDCNGFTAGIENSEGHITYKVTFESDYFLLTPTSVICTEGCSYKYKKITND